MKEAFGQAALTGRGVAASIAAMDPVAEQYETYPYPAREPADEAKRLIVGSPSDPAEIDHFLFGGARDWSKPFRALVAGGGTGDALVMMAQRLTDAGAPYELVYLDRSQASRRIAEARIAARGLGGVRFHTGDLLDAAGLGPFDYVDCCGVLHHLPDPQAGFDALAAALAPGGGMGGMVYAPYGRTGVYPLQAALATLTAGMSPERKVARARATLAALPPTNWFTRNELLGDHRASDAGLYDLLLHARDTPFTADAVMRAVAQAGLDFAGFIQPARYAPETWAGGAPVPELDPPARAALAEQLSGALKAHVFYAAKGPAKPAAFGPRARPRLRGASAGQLAAAAGKGFVVRLDGVSHRISPPRAAAPALRLMDGRRRYGEIAAALGSDWLAFAALMAPVHRTLAGYGALLVSETFA
jgi:SAM-dependent methyltransferase